MRRMPSYVLNAFSLDVFPGPVSMWGAGRRAPRWAVLPCGLHQPLVRLLCFVHVHEFGVNHVALS
ncbi:MAG: hypothetical protein ACRD5L_06275, partial [Bryobacteraceae bacterium]